MRKHKKNRGIMKQVVGSVTLRPRVERHSKPLSEVYWTKEIVKVDRGVRVNPTTGEAEMYVERKVVAPRRPMTPQEIADSRYKVKRALSPTMRHGRRNLGGKAK